MIEHNPVHYSRHVPWGGASGFADLIIYGQNWAAATFVWTFAASEGSTALITLTGAAAGVQGVSATYDANAVNPETGAVEGATTIRPQIDEATLEGLNWATLAEKVLYHDLLVTPTGLPQIALVYGTFTIRVGVGD